MDNKYKGIQEIKKNYIKQLPTPNTEWPPSVQRAVCCIQKHLFDSELMVLAIKEIVNLLDVKDKEIVSCFLQTQEVSPDKINGQIRKILYNLITILMALVSSMPKLKPTNKRAYHIFFVKLNQLSYER